MKAIEFGGLRATVEDRIDFSVDENGVLLIKLPTEEACEDIRISNYPINPEFSPGREAKLKNQLQSFFQITKARWVEIEPIGLPADGYLGYQGVALGSSGRWWIARVMISRDPQSTEWWLAHWNGPERFLKGVVIEVLSAIEIRQQE